MGNYLDIRSNIRKETEDKAEQSKPELSNDRYTFTKIHIITIIILVLFIIFVVYFAFSSNRIQNKPAIEFGEIINQSSDLENATIYYKDKVVVKNMPYKLDMDDNSPVYIDLDVGQYSNLVNPYVSIKSYYTDLKCYLDGKLIYSYYSPKTTALKSVSTSHHFIELGALKKDSKIRFQLNTLLEKNIQIRISKLSIGPKSSVVIATIFDELPEIIFFTFLFFAFITILIWNISNLLKGILSPRLLNTNILIFIVGIYFTLPLKSFNILFGMNVSAHIIEYASLSIITIPFIRNFELTSDKRYKIFYDLIIIVVLANALFQLIVVYLGISEYREMLKNTHLILMFSTAVPIILTLISGFNTKIRKDVLLSTLPSAILFILGTLTYVFTQFVDYYYFFWLAIISYSIVNIHMVVQRSARTFKENLKIDYYKEIALKDALTGIGNRLAYNDTIEQLSKNGLPIWVFSIDMNGLKIINDRFGHLEGDEVLTILAQSISHVTEKYSHGSCFRIGGDEFCVLIPQDKCENAEFFLDNLEREIKSVNEGLKKEYKISVSIGYTLLDPLTNTIEKAIYNADREMYRMKTEFYTGSDRSSRRNRF